MIQLWLTPPVSTAPDDVITACEAIIGSSEQYRLLQLNHSRQKLFLISRALLRCMLTNAVSGDIQSHEWDIVERVDLPPACSQAEQMGLQFSISHSNDVVGIAMGTGETVGLDLECGNRKRDFAAIAREWFHPLEAEELELVCGEEQKVLFYRLWTLKEAYLKSRQLGIGSGLLRKVRFVSSKNIGKKVGVSTSWDDFYLSLVSTMNLTVSCSCGFPLTNVDRSFFPLNFEYFQYVEESP